MNQFILKLRILLLQNKFYYILFILGTIIALIVTKYSNYDSIYEMNMNEFEMKINSYKIDGSKLTLELGGKEKLIGNYYFETEEEKNAFVGIYSIGDKIKLTGNLKRPKNNTIPNTFNYKEYLKNKHIYYTLKIEKISLIEKNSNIFYKIKNYVYKRISSIDNNAYIYALVLGESVYIDSETYRINGVSHLFSLSGLHVSLIANMLLFSIKYLKRFTNLLKKKTISKQISEEKVKTYIFIFMFLMLFAFITGFKPSFLRSIIFFMLMGINKVYYYNVKGDNLLILVYIIMIIINPFYIYDISFQLSWTITFFLFFTSELCKSNNYIIKLLWASFISLVTSLPIIINNFYTVNLLSIVNNLFFVPFVSYVIYPLSLFTIIFPFLNKILRFFVVILEIISSFLANVKIFNIDFSKLSIYEIIIYYILFLLFIKSKKKILYGILIVLLIIFSFIKTIFNKTTDLYFIDVGQGDSALIKTTNNMTIMIDTGGYLKYEQDAWQKKRNEFNLMNTSIVPFFKSKGIKKIDYLFLTHADEDHSGYAQDLVNNFETKNIIINNGNLSGIEKDLNYQKIDKYYYIDGVKIYSLNDKIYDNENDNSLILLIIIDNKKLLFMGDASIKQEKYIINKYNLEDIFILKVGHHGSKTSSSRELIEETRPKYSIISVGEDNKFNHPNKSVIDTLNKYNTIIYRTDEVGSINFKFNKNDVNIKYYLPY